MSANTFTAGLMVRPAHAARMVPAITLTSAPLPSVRQFAAIALAKQAMARNLGKINHYQETAQCA